MTNKSSKGRKIEKKFEHILNELGFVTHRARKNVIMTRQGQVFSQRNDIFGLWDIMAKHPSSADFTYYFQISTVWKSGEARKELEAFIAGVCDKLFMVRKENREEFEIKLYHPDDNKWVPSTLKELMPR